MLERELLKKIKEGNSTIFHYFMDLYSKDLYLFALGYVRTREIAEEVVSDVFLSVWQNRQKLDQIRSIRTWLFVMTKNRSISYLRKENPDTILSIDDVGEVDNYFISNIQAPDSQIISDEEMARINGAINALPPKCKEVFMLAKIEKIPYKEISRILNISVKTINVHIAKAVGLISKILNE
ncbi:MAG: RNA polymerase sigma-70 factor [Massilibacteroides sp.]|nr:RNA polymerase sigma-70 factor [Massilibacteroides sp.]MDD3063362.1 RNA polymerase sigma-70 factor [Massilibacteroides sp.]MDD4114349.1 RNA polymerase sigma-70 factor [Massilibacteroides sp.]MDD4659694.1 RNA polymerase sigma-70 factor [Massilibacteroides sp.]